MDRVGIVLVVIGALAGLSDAVVLCHSSPLVSPPLGWTAVFYLPALVGMYMILLHTVVNGWRQRA